MTASACCTHGSLITSPYRGDTNAGDVIANRCRYRVLALCTVSSYHGALVSFSIGLSSLWITFMSILNILLISPVVIT